MRLLSLSTLAAFAALAAAVSGAPVWAADLAPSLTILEGYGQGSITDRVIGVLQPALEKHIGQPVTVEHAGHGALDRIATAAPDGSTVLVFGLLPLEIGDATHEPGAKLPRLTPIAKLTGPVSVALVVRNESPIHNWADFATAAHARRLSIASPGWGSACHVATAMMERELGVHFTVVPVEDCGAILDALLTKKADAGCLVALATLPTPKLPVPPVRPVVTFGAKRYPALNQVPTFQETIGPQPLNRRHNSITAAIGLFGPSGMTTEEIGRLVAEFAAVGAEAKQSGAIALVGCRSRSATPPCCARRWRATRGS